MIPLVRSIVHALLWDPMAARRWLRGLAVAFSIGGVAFANDVADVIGHPGAGKTIKVVALALAFIGGAISVGQQNPKAPDLAVVYSATPPPRGVIMQAQIVFLLVLGFALFLYAMAHVTGAQ